MEGDTLSSLKITINDSATKARISLDTVFTATLTWSIDEGTSTTKAMNVLTGPEDGIVEYQFTAGELTPGTMLAQVTITEISSGKVATTINEIRKEVGASL